MGWLPFRKSGGLAGAKTAAQLEGGGTSTTPLVLGATANKNFIGYWARNTAASGDSRLVYLREFFNGAAGGETLRAYATAESATTAVGGTVNGAHVSLSVAVGAQVSGAGNAARFTLDAAAAPRVLGGTLNVIELDSNIGAGNTVGAGTAFIKFDDEGSVKLTNLFNVPTSGSGLIVAPHTTQVMTDSIRIVMADGNVRYIMLTTASSNRTGGA